MDRIHQVANKSAFHSMLNTASNMKSTAVKKWCLIFHPFSRLRYCWSTPRYVILTLFSVKRKAQRLPLLFTWTNETIFSSKSFKHSVLDKLCAWKRMQNSYVSPIGLIILSAHYETQNLYMRASWFCKCTISHLKQEGKICRLEQRSYFLHRSPDSQSQITWNF